MFVRAICCAVGALFLSSLVVSAASAQIPPQPVSQTVVYRIHDDPNDPESAIVFTVMLLLELEAADGDSIGWEITKIQFRQPGQNGGADTIWIKPHPDVPTADGLWWVEHADRDNPQLKEFDEPPHLVGTAASQDPSGTDLEYGFEGVSYAPPPGGAPWDPTAALDYDFALVGAPAPLEGGTDEPVEVDDDDDEPTSGG